MDIISCLKNVGGVLATLTTLVYVSGYLALRTRAFVLGTDPAFAIAYEGYVFAGFRFLFISLIILLLVCPIILAVRWGASWMCLHVPGALLSAGQWLLLVLLAIWALYITARILSVNGLLLQQRSGSHSFLEDAVLGGQMAIAVMFAVLFLASLSVLWLIARLPAGRDSFTWILGIVVAMQLISLPICYGALYADRKVRVLAVIPSAVKDLKAPLGIVDRTNDHVTLLGLDKNNERSIVVVKLDDLNGVPVKEIVSLKMFFQNELSHAGEKGVVSMPKRTRQEATVSDGKTKAAKGFFQQLVDYLHMTFENIGSLGGNVVTEGQVWSVELDATGKPDKPIRIGTASNLAWPVCSVKGRGVYAIQGGRIVRLGDDGQSLADVDKQKQWIKLLGATEHGDVLGMITEKGESMLAVLHADGTIAVSPTPTSDEEQRYKSMLEQENRAYAGGRTLYVERSTRGSRGFDVFLRKEGEVTNLSDCGDDRCGQPSLSPDFRRVLYVRKSR
jgi:hypothetical protein